MILHRSPHFQGLKKFTEIFQSFFNHHHRFISAKNEIKDGVKYELEIRL